MKRAVLHAAMCKTVLQLNNMQDDERPAAARIDQCFYDWTALGIYNKAKCPATHATRTQPFGRVSSQPAALPNHHPSQQHCHPPGSSRQAQIPFWPAFT